MLSAPGEGRASSASLPPPRSPMSTVSEGRDPTCPSLGRLPSPPESPRPPHGHLLPPPGPVWALLPRAFWPPPPWQGLLSRARCESVSCVSPASALGQLRGSQWVPMAGPGWALKTEKQAGVWRVVAPAGLGVQRPGAGCLSRGRGPARARSAQSPGSVFSRCSRPASRGLRQPLQKLLCRSQWWGPGLSTSCCALGLRRPWAPAGHLHHLRPQGPPHVVSTQSLPAPHSCGRSEQERRGPDSWLLLLVRRRPSRSRRESCPLVASHGAGSPDPSAGRALALSWAPFPSLLTPLGIVPFPTLLRPPSPNAVSRHCFLSPGLSVSVCKVGHNSPCFKGFSCATVTSTEPGRARK